MQKSNYARFSWHLRVTAEEHHSFPAHGLTAVTVTEARALYPLSGSSTCTRSLAPGMTDPEIVGRRTPRPAFFSSALDEGQGCRKIMMQPGHLSLNFHLVY